MFPNQHHSALRVTVEVRMMNIKAVTLFNFHPHQNLNSSHTPPYSTVLFILVPTSLFHIKTICMYWPGIPKKSALIKPPKHGSLIPAKFTMKGPLIFSGTFSFRSLVTVRETYWHLNFRGFGILFCWSRESKSLPTREEYNRPGNILESSMTRGSKFYHVGRAKINK